MCYRVTRIKALSETEFLTCSTACRRHGTRSVFIDSRLCGCEACFLLSIPSIAVTAVEPQFSCYCNNPLRKVPDWLTDKQILLLTNCEIKELMTNQWCLIYRPTDWQTAWSTLVILWLLMSRSWNPMFHGTRMTISVASKVSTVLYPESFQFAAQIFSAYFGNVR
jgi:hypothetical protein